MKRLTLILMIAVVIIGTQHLIQCSSPLGDDGSNPFPPIHDTLIIYDTVVDTVYFGDTIFVVDTILVVDTAQTYRRELRR